MKKHTNTVIWVDFHNKYVMAKRNVKFDLTNVASPNFTNNHLSDAYNYSRPLGAYPHPYVEPPKHPEETMHEYINRILENRNRK